MAGRQQVHYFRIGLFLIISIVVLIGLVLFFNSASFLKKHVLVETYFNESVQGLAMGSPVKYRGITIGHVKDIGLLNHEYNLSPSMLNEDRYVYVLISINSSFLTDIPPDRLQEQLTRDVQQGLRAKLGMLDLTGNAYIEINFMNPKQNPSLPIYWRPKHYYIPSTVSVLTRFTDNAQTLLQNLQAVNFQKFFTEADALIATTNQTMKTADKTAQSISRATQSFDTATQSLDRLL